MRIAIFGASGKTGRLTVARAVDRGHEVTAVARHLEVLHPAQGLRLQHADVRDGDAVRAAIERQDAVLSLVGTSARKPDEVYSAAARSLVAALEAVGVKRLIAVSSGGVRPDDPGLPWWFRVAIPLFLADLYRDMAEMERIVRASDLDWTLVRASYLVDKPARGRYRVEDGRNPHRGRQISRADLAEFLLDQLEDGTWVHKAPSLAY